MDAFLGELRLFPYSFAPQGWAECNGQLMPLSQNTALFALLGTVYGGDGKSTFGLPDLRGAVPVGAGQGPGLREWHRGWSDGVATVTLLESEVPVHVHGLRAATSDPADTNVPSPAASFAPSTSGRLYQPTPDAVLAWQALALAGGSLPHSNLMPYLTMRWCIALQGAFPPRQ